MLYTNIENQTMLRPKKIQGYDILIWCTKDREVLTCAYTKKGVAFLKTLDKDHKRRDIMEIVAMPDEFLAQVPPDVKVGMIHPNTKKVSSAHKNHLH